jgi:hypothetical protein
LRQVPWLSPVGLRRLHLGIGLRSRAGLLGDEEVVEAAQEEIPFLGRLPVVPEIQRSRRSLVAVKESSAWAAED